MKRNAYKMHETRMWLQNIIIPAIFGIAGVMTSNPDMRSGVSEIWCDVKNKIRRIFSK